jgi:hypothetical protein
MGQRLERISKADPQILPGQMRKRFGSPDPLIQARKAVSVSEAIGHAELGFHRGHCSGVFDAYLTLKEAYPEAANALLTAFRMRDDNGEWVLE